MKKLVAVYRARSRSSTGTLAFYTVGAAWIPDVGPRLDAAEPMEPVEPPATVVVAGVELHVYTRIRATKGTRVHLSGARVASVPAAGPGTGSRSPGAVAPDRGAGAPLGGAVAAVRDRADAGPHLPGPHAATLAAALGVVEHDGLPAGLGD